MISLQNGVKIFSISPSWNPIWRPESGYTSGKSQYFVAYALTWVRSDRSPKFQRLYPCFRGRPVQWYVCRHHSMLISTGNWLETGSTYNSETNRDISSIPVPTPMFSGSPSSMNLPATLSETENKPEMEINLPRPEVVITRQWNGLFVCFQRQNPCFRGRPSTMDISATLSEADD